jgi:capsule biosynthesis phosphatase
MKRIIMDLDDTISVTRDGNYAASEPDRAVIEKMRTYKKLGFVIVINSSRNMRTYDRNIGLINANTLPKIIDWLIKHDVPYDEVYIGKPWCGFEGFYVDDKSIRPDEFKDLDYDQIKVLLGIGK